MILVILKFSTKDKRGIVIQDATFGQFIRGQLKPERKAIEHSDMTGLVCRRLDILLMTLLLVLDASRLANGAAKRKGHSKAPELTLKQQTPTRRPLRVSSTAKPMERKNNTRVLEQVGTSATLECEAFIPNVTVVWAKMDKNGNNVIITANETTLVDDMRFLPVRGDNNVWKLRIRYTEPSDSGTYECQVCDLVHRSTFSIYVNLELVEAYAEILGDNPREVKPKLPLRLICILQNSIEEASYIFWYRDERVINYDLGPGAAVRESRLGSELIYPKAGPEHSGNYSCVPSNARQASVSVIVSRPSD